MDAVSATGEPAACCDEGVALSAGVAHAGAIVPPAWYEPAAAWIPDSSMASNCAAGIVFSSLTTWLPAVVPHQSSVVPPKNQSAPLSARIMP